MYKRIVVLLFLSLVVIELPAQKTDKRLRGQVQELIRGFNGQIGIYVKNVNNLILVINGVKIVMLNISNEISTIGLVETITLMS